MVAVCWFCNRDTDTLESPNTQGHVNDCPVQLMENKGFSELEITDIISKIREEQIWNEKKNQWERQLYQLHGERTIKMGGLVIDLKFVDGKKIHNEQRSNLHVAVWEDLRHTTASAEWRHINETEVEVS